MTIAKRITIVSIVVSLVITALISRVFFNVLYQERHAQALAQAQLVSQHHTDQLMQRHHGIKTTLQYIDQSGLIPLFLANHIDESIIDGLFRGALSTDPHFFQVRVLDLEGQEVFRLDQRDDRTFTVPTDKLQNKAHRPYMQTAFTLKAGDMYFSDLSLNEEFGAIEQPERVTLRGIIAIANHQQQVVGYVAINQNLNDTLRVIDDNTMATNIYVTNQQGDYIYHADRNKTFAKQRRGTANLSLDFPHLFETIHANNPELAPLPYLILADAIVQFINVGTAQHPSPLTVIQLIDHAHIDAEVRQSLYDFFWIPVLAFVAVFAMGAGIVILIHQRVQHLQTILARFKPNTTSQPTAAIKANESQGDELRQAAQALSALLADLERNQSALEDAYQKMEQLFNTIPSAVVLSDEAGTILETNQATQNLFGYTREELINNNVTCLMPVSVATHHDHYMAHSALTDQPKLMGNRREQYALRRDGSLLAVEIIVSSYTTQQGKRFVAVMQDVSDLRQAQDDLEHQSNLLRQRNKILENFAAALSHDLKAPIRRVAQLIHFIDSDSLSEDDRELLGKAEKQALYAHNMVSALHAFSTVGLSTPQLSECDLAAIAQEAIDFAADQYPDLTIHATISPLPILQTDSTLITQVFQNLIENTCKYGQSNPQKNDTQKNDTHNVVEITIEPVTLPSDSSIPLSTLSGHVCIAFQDRGRGIPAEHHQSIFNIFHRVQPNTAIEGTGVGLSTCRTIMSALGGLIVLDVAYTEGARFLLCFPKSQPTAETYSSATPGG